MAVISVVGVIPIFNQIWPDDCPKQVKLNMNFNVGAGGFDAYVLDMQQQVTNGQIKGIQSCYYNNKAQAAAFVTVEVGDTGQEMTFRPGFQGYRPLLFSEIPKAVFRCSAGTGVFQLTLLNTPMQPIEWNAL